jgi:uncharacterized membrane protein YdcZ (DUF606 family)
MIIDHYGVMGVEPSPAALQRAIGVALAVAGIVVRL